MKIPAIHPAAAQEIEEAAVFYELRSGGLGMDFARQVELALDDIASSPMRWPLVHGDVRRRLLARFPYGVFYRIGMQGVVVLAVGHLRRRPLYWIDREETGQS